MSVSTYNTVQLGWDNIEINKQNKCCHKGAKKVNTKNSEVTLTKKLTDV